LLTKSQAFRAAREQIGYGPNLLKVYADWGAPTLTIEENPAHRRGGPQVQNKSGRPR